MNIFKKVQEPDFASSLETLKQNIIYNYNFHRIGIIEAFDNTNQTSTVRIADKKVIFDENKKILQDYLVLEQCPTVINKGKNGGITIPIVKGDNCLICFNDRDIDNWFTTGTVQEPNTPRCHDMSDGVVIVGLNSIANTIQDYNNLATEINYLNTIISLQQDLIQIKSNGKIEISNQSKNLLDILKGLINAIKGLQVLDPQSGSPIGFINGSSLDSSRMDLEILLK